MLNSVYYTINNVVHLIGGEYSIWNKFKLSLTFCRLTFKSEPFLGDLTFKSELLPKPSLGC